jgi:hypothetical protein
MNRNWRDLIGGIFLVPALHLAFLLLLTLLAPVFHRSKIFGIMFSLSSAGIGIGQFVYVIPVMLVYRHRRRFEIVKGISIGAVITVLLNGVCFGILPHAINSLYPLDPDDYFFLSISYLLVVIAITIAIMLITFYAFNRRSRSK